MKQQWENGAVDETYGQYCYFSLSEWRDEKYCIQIYEINYVVTPLA